MDAIQELLSFCGASGNGRLPCNYSFTVYLTRFLYRSCDTLPPSKCCNTMSLQFEALVESKNHRGFSFSLFPFPSPASFLPPADLKEGRLPTLKWKVRDPLLPCKKLEVQASSSSRMWDWQLHTTSRRDIVFCRRGFLWVAKLPSPRLVKTWTLGLPLHTHMLYLGSSRMPPMWK